MTGTLLPDYFNSLYARDPDPWRFRTSEYERDKYADTVAHLAQPRYPRACEVGCAIGELTSVLATRCDDLLGIDVAEAALAQARIRNADAAHVRFQRILFPDQAPDGPFNLIALSEVLYYFSAEDMRRVADAVTRMLAPDGEVLLVHWLGETPEYPQTGEEAVDGFIRATASSLATDLQRRRPMYRVDRLKRRANGAG